MKKTILILLIVGILFLVSCQGPPPDFNDFPLPVWTPRPTYTPPPTPLSCVREGESLGAVVPGNYKQCCPGLVPYVPRGVLGSRGNCVLPTPYPVPVPTVTPTPKPINELQFGSPGDLLELDETLGSVRQALTEYDTPILKGSTISTQFGVTKVNQYLQFPSQKDYRSNKVVFGKNKLGNVGRFLFAKQADELATLILEFEEGLKFSLYDQLRGRKINILGKEFTIANAPFSQLPQYQFSLDLMSGLVVDKLSAGSKRTYLVNGKEYAVEVLTISQNNNEVFLKINGAVLPKMKVAQTEPTTDGLLIGVVSLENNVAELALGATHLTLYDDNWADNEFKKEGAVVNNVGTDDINVGGTGNDVRMIISKLNENTWALSSVSIKINANGRYSPSKSEVNNFIGEYVAISFLLIKYM